MTDLTEREIWEKMMSEPFKPADVTETPIEGRPWLRIAHALEYIAAQTEPKRKWKPADQPPARAEDSEAQRIYDAMFSPKKRLKRAKIGRTGGYD